MVQTQLEQVAKSQRELLDEMHNNVNDFAVRVATTCNAHDAAISLTCRGTT